jgi:hypothetical protein
MDKNNTQVNYKKVKTIGKSVSNSIFKTLDYEVKVKGQKVMRKMTVGTFTKKYPFGTFIIIVSGHAFTIKDGVVIGNHDDAVQKRKRVLLAWKVGS